MSRPIIATINQKALKHNLSIVRSLTPKLKIWAVIKANAYGHGINNVWSLSDTDGFALLNIEEAVMLREHGWEKPILLLEGFFHPKDLYIIDRYQLTTTIHSQWQIKALENIRLLNPISIYLKINSGMNRLGFHQKLFNTIWNKLIYLKNIRDITLMMHCSNTNNISKVNKYFKNIQNLIKGRNCLCSISNSACLLWHQTVSYDCWVRVGILLYGASPSGNWFDISNINLEPAMTLSSKIIGIQTLKTGDTIGYGDSYTVKKPQRIGIVACGYADGYPRHAPTGTPVLVDGNMTHLVGTVSMDMITIDLTNCPRASIGSNVELWGNIIKIDQVAKAAGTLGYHLMCSLAPRVPIKIIC
ncbi:alanine racemase [Candidatus Pantoea edessiphila]|uniref:Alanine racemase n=1 Tax=Candidatus Pantoea edessiphila TaxID=2044610 RepID=A0A2P5SYN7_9GAMM|nr:alanine racemase [Candidatus Pantoea edessiphila]MBK4775424.1 alanine racemase [Pantoea sp. Edef]PPI87446.1 alanine racemase [Candidatus Pantoea edessiphila]